MNTYRFLWIDDDHVRKDFCDSIEAARFPGLGRAKVEFVDVRNRDLTEVISGELKTQKPHLVILDHFLNNAKGLVKLGSSLSELLREKWPRCPIVAVTGAQKEADIGTLTRDQYDEVFSISDMLDNRLSLFSLTVGYRRLGRNRPRSIEAILRLLKCPPEAAELVKVILPSDLRDRFDDATLVRRFSTWVRHTLQAKPGPLYDRKWIANHLGLNEDGFRKVESKFRSAKYDGIFCSIDLWWTSKVRNLLYQLTKANSQDLPWIAGRKLPGVSPSDQSKCRRCQKRSPELLGYSDLAENAKLVPLHLACSKPHPRLNAPPHFEEWRVMVSD